MVIIATMTTCSICDVHAETLLSLEAGIDVRRGGRQLEHIAGDDYCHDDNRPVIFTRRPSNRWKLKWTFQVFR